MVEDLGPGAAAEPASKKIKAEESQESSAAVRFTYTWRMLQEDSLCDLEIMHRPVKPQTFPGGSPMRKALGQEHC